MADKKSLKEQVYAAVIRDVISGEYPPNAILSEKQLIERFSVSKSPVRDALIELCNEGVLRSIPRFGYEVVAYTEKDVREIIEFRGVLESHCLRQCAGSLTAADFERLDQFLVQSEQLAHSEQEIVAHWENNVSFHLLLCSLAQNEYIYKELERSMNVQLRAYAQFHWDRWHKTAIILDVDTHKMIVRALARRDLEEALRVLRQDLGLWTESGSPARF